jgi:uncharacterized phage-associated protein
MFMITPTTLTDFICLKVIEAGDNISVLKAQKLLYYVQSWHIVFNDRKPLFDDDFQAWVHGPVCTNVFSYHKYTLKKTMYDDIRHEEIHARDFSSVTSEIADHVGSILETYGKFSGAQLEALTHREKPWLDARKGLKPFEPSSNPISKESIYDFYSKMVR